MNKAQRIEVFKETENIINKGFYTNSQGEKIEIKETNSEGLSLTDAVCYTVDMTKYVPFNQPFEEGTVISVINEDCLTAARTLLNEGLFPAVLNMASATHPCGGVENGAAAQEENICRRSNLSKALYGFDMSSFGINRPRITRNNAGYPLDMKHGVIYSPCITVFRDVEERNYALLDKPYIIDVISAPALKRPSLKDGHLSQEDKDITKSKIRAILNAGIMWDNDALVLGAFGCGAYGNPPEEIAQLFKEVLTQEKNYQKQFKKIIFAIIDDKNAYRRHNPRGNYMPFKEVFDSI